MSDRVSIDEPEVAATPAAGEAAQPSGDPAPDLELDCRGMNCPLPILKTKKAMDSLAAGRVLKMVATDPGSIPDVAAFSRRTGHEIVQQSEGGGEFTFWLRKV